MKKSNDKPLTLDELVEYNQKVFFPTLEKRFVTKDDFKKHKDDFKKHKDDFKKHKDEMFGFKHDMLLFKDEMTDFKKEMLGFKDEMLTNQDKMLKKLDTLLTEKTVRDHQREREKKLWLLIIKALKDHKILTDKQLEQIAQLEIF